MSDAVKRFEATESVSPRPPRVRVNLTISQPLVAEARERGLNLSELADQALAQEIKRLREADWLSENAEAIRHHNERVGKHGTYLAAFRRF